MERQAGEPELARLVGVYQHLVLDSPKGLDAIGHEICGLLRDETRRHAMRK